MPSPISYVSSVTWSGTDEAASTYNDVGGSTSVDGQKYTLPKAGQNPFWLRAIFFVTNQPISSDPATLNLFNGNSASGKIFSLQLGQYIQPNSIAMPLDCYMRIDKGLFVRCDESIAGTPVIRACKMTLFWS
jgi:hypothetical protein